MSPLRTILAELIGLFVDDAGLALFAALLIAAVTAAVKLMALPALGGAILLLVGSVAILADSVRRAAKRR